MHFRSRYEREFGFTMPDRPIVVDDIRVRGLAKHCFDFPYDTKVSNSPPKYKTVSLFLSF